MLVVPFVPEPLGTALTQAGWSWADAAGNFDLRADNLVLRQRSTATRPRGKASRLPQGSGSLAIIHFGDEIAEILRRLHTRGPLFPHLRRLRAGDRATESSCVRS